MADKQLKKIEMSIGRTQSSMVKIHSNKSAKDHHSEACQKTRDLIGKTQTGFTRQPDARRFYTSTMQPVTVPITLALLHFAALNYLSAAPETAAFLEQHCTKCHGAEKQKGDVRLDNLGSPTATGETGEIWLTVLEVLESGDMPPKKEPRPDANALTKVVADIANALAESAEPPIALRRLNRTEYEHTLHDLLGIDTPLVDLLPEDSRVQGFDNVADGLSISSILMERYLEAADVAFEATIRRIKPMPAETRRSMIMEGKENTASVEQNKGGVIEKDGAFVKFTPGWPPVRIDEAHPIEDGRYRVRMAVWPHDAGERTLSVAAYVGPLFGPGKRRFHGMFDVTGTPAEPRIIEFEAFMEENETVHIVPWVYPEHVTWRDKHEKRPGIGVVWAETFGPLDQSFPSQAQRRLFGDNGSLSMAEGENVWMRHRKGVKRHYVTSSTPEADAERIIRDLLPRAFRRPVDNPIADPFVKLTLDRLAQGRTFEQAVRAGVSAVLCAPQFLLLNREENVDDYTIASRLSYFLWSSMPDDELLELAAAGKLSDPDVRHAQVERMLKDAKIGRLVENFTGQWLELREIEFTSPDKKLYPEFDPMLQESMLRETRGFFRHIIENNLSVTNFIDSDFTVLNERLANHYKIDGVKGHENSRVVRLAGDSIRGGVLAQGSVLKVSANGTTTSPVLRGVWVLDKLLGKPAPPPPPGVPAVEPDIRGAISIRDQLAKHSEDNSCAICHARIDPPGFALECFDPIGGERSWYRSLGEGKRISKRENYTKGPDVDPSGELPDGAKFENFREFRAILAGREDEFARALASKLLIFASGRPMTVADRPSIDTVVLAAKNENLGLRAMVHAVVETPMFLRR
jgi:mono/diheme cytochrome c family protein